MIISAAFIFNNKDFKMCGRYSIFANARAIEKRFKAKFPNEGELQPRYNAAPTQTLPIITNNNEGERTIEFFHWGLIPSWADNPAIGSKMLNARAETLAEKPSFKNALKKRRCLVLADGFYEWQQIGKQKQPVRTSLKSGDVFAMAGLWEKWTDKESGEIIHSFTIITTEANELLKPVHDRMPVILSPKNEDLWLSNELGMDEHLRLLKPYNDSELKVEPVSKLVNNAGFDECSILNPDSGEPGELLLF
ncbi:MAG TPA: SOS response-associated peptidase [Patescibacteria group bacterium]|nr:SOS response-associated peptidase [Patescibacteria group bacterium]